MARYINHHQTGIHVPEPVISRIQSAADKAAECIACAAELVSNMKESGFSGVVLSTLGWEDRIPEILGQVDT